MRHDSGAPRTVVGLLVLASITIITLDVRGGSSSPVEPMRAAVSTVFGPVQEGATALMSPVRSLPDRFADVEDLQDQVADLEAENSELATQLRAAEANINRSSELERIAAFADTAGYQVVAAQVIGMGSAQTFSRTVTIDAGTRDGVVPDLTVVNADGLVGRVIEASASTATVLLIVDSESTVGGRLSTSMELGFLDGDGQLSGASTLQLSLVDHTVAPREGDVVVTWGSHNGAPYLPGVPVGAVVSVHSSPSELTQTATIAPFVDFSSLDVVAVVTDGGSTTDRTQQAGADR
jgi:rod shape-determining protein MreC